MKGAARAAVPHVPAFLEVVRGVCRERRVHLPARVGRRFTGRHRPALWQYWCGWGGTARPWVPLRGR